jgi:hypothetical protein
MDPKQEIDAYFVEYKEIELKNQDELTREDRYPFADKILKIEFENSKNDLAQIYKKVILLNSLYSTNIYATFDVALNISNIENFSIRAKNGDLELVEEIRKNRIAETDKDFYSFATKYCHHHNPKAFPIYDSFVENSIIYYLSEFDPETRVHRTRMKRYDYFKQQIDKLAAIWHLPKSYLYTKLDKYLWKKGKKSDF